MMWTDILTGYWMQTERMSKKDLLINRNIFHLFTNLRYTSPYSQVWLESPCGQTGGGYQGDRSIRKLPVERHRAYLRSQACLEERLPMCREDPVVQAAGTQHRRFRKVSSSLWDPVPCEDRLPHFTVYPCVSELCRCLMLETAQPLTECTTTSVTTSNTPPTKAT